MATLEQILFENPWVAPDLPSLVYEDASGIVGFLGVVPRPVIFRGERLRLAVGTRFMVDPSCRGLVGLHLIREFLNGAQDVTISDVVNDSGYRVWKGFGGHPVLLFNLFWVRALRPARHAIGAFGRGRAARGVRLMLRPLVNGIDALVARWDASPYRVAVPDARTEALDPEEVLGALPDVLGPHAFRPDYDEHAFRWLLDRVAEKHGADTLERVQVRGGGGELIGWYVYLSNPGGVGQVVQIAARPGRGGDVLDHLFHHAWRNGLTALAGRMEPALAGDLVSRQCAFDRHGPWFLAHARRPEIVHAIERGDAFHSRLEGEWWMNFR